MSEAPKEAAEHILPLYMNGLAGRMLRLPASGKRRREILLIAGQHTSIERIYGMAEYLNRFGPVTSPDLPGFGGMDPFYKIGEKATLDNYADYLASFIKLRYRGRKFTIMAVSFSFSVITRMLQRYPEIVEKIDLLISVSGIVDQKDFKWNRRNMFLSRTICKLLMRRLPAIFVTRLILRGPIIRFIYHVAERKHPKLRDADSSERADRINFEIRLWKINDFRTWMETCLIMLRLNLGHRHVALPVYHVSVDDDHYFDNLRVEQHMRAIYKDFQLIKTKLPAHVPTILATPKDVEPFVPPKIRQLLREKA